MTKRDERWTAQDVALVKARQQLARAVKTPPLEAVTARTYIFTVPGLAQPGGSKQAFVPVDKSKLCNCGPKPVYLPFRRPNGSIMTNVVDANPKVGKWKKHVARIAHEEYPGPIFDGFLRVTFVFYQPRPQDHYTSTGKLSKHGIETPWPNVVPDALKLARAAEDALTGLCWTDDAIIVKEVIEKEYGVPPRVEITIEELVLPATQDQPALFEDLAGSQPPWEITGSADGRLQTPGDTSDQANGAKKPRGTSGAGRTRSDRNQTPGTDDPPPF